MAVSVVVPTRDRPQHLARCVEAVQAVLRPGDELVVVDSASRLPVEHATIRCERPGAAHARNVGVAIAANDVVAFTDDDCRPQPGWPAALETVFADPLVGVVAGRVVPDRADRALVLSVSPADLAAAADPAGVANGANLAVRRKAFAAVGGFDESLGPGTDLANGEDYDLWWRIGQAGFRRAVAPDAVVVHEQWRTRARALATCYRYGVGDGAFVTRAGSPSTLVVDRVWRRGLRAVARDVVRGHELAAVADACRLAGFAAGVMRARRRPAAVPDPRPGAATPAPPGA